MLLQQHAEEPTSHSAAAELRLDRDTAEKVTALALRLQEKRGGTLSVREIEEAGKEVGLEPEFIHEALAQVRQSQRPAVAQTPGWLKWGKVIHPAWWAAGWAFPAMIAPAAEALHLPDDLTGAAVIGAMGIYIGVGVALSMLFGDHSSKSLTKQEQEALIRSIGKWTSPSALEANTASQGASTAATIARLTAPAGGVHLHVVPRLESGTATDFAVWALSLIRQEGGELLAATADSIECRFSSADAAIRAARRLQEQGQGLLACGFAPASTGSRQLAMNAASGDVLIDESYAAEGLRELGRLTRLEIGPRGALSWKAGRDG